MYELIGLSYSPWSEKAKWALDHHKIPYDYSEHLMIFGMPLLRYKMKKLFGDVTVPALIGSSPDETGSWGDSFEIAHHADHIGKGSHLFPKKHLSEIGEFNTLSETGLDAARALMMERMQRNPLALQEALPPWTPMIIRKRFIFMALFGLKYVQREFHSSKKTLSAHYETLHRALSTFKEALGKKTYLLDSFTYADITLAVMLHGLQPVHHPRFPLSPEIRKCWTTQELIKEFASLLAWRDNLYQTHR